MVLISVMLYTNIKEVIALELIRKQTYITPAQDRAVKLLAQRQGTTEADVLRKALDLFLVKEGLSEVQDPFADLVGMFEGSAEVEHDDIYL